LASCQSIVHACLGFGSERRKETSALERLKKKKKPTKTFAIESV